MQVRFAAAALLTAALFLFTAPARAGALPPGASDLLYRGEPVLICYTSLPPYCFTNGKLKIVNVGPAVVNGAGDLESFDVQFSADFSAPIAIERTFTGTGQFILPARTNDSLVGPFFAEMLSLNLSDGGGVLIRESPTLASDGEVTVENDGGGNFTVSSFFDVFTELSLDGGQTWAPADQSARLTYTPEPATQLLAGVALLFLAHRMRRH